MAVFTAVVPVTPRKAMYATPKAKATENTIMKIGLGTAALKTLGHTCPVT